MSATLTHSWKHPAWVLSLEQFPNLSGGAAVASTGSGQLIVHSLESHATQTIRAHESSINAIVKIDENTLASASTDGVKVWDLRSSTAVASLGNARKASFLSVGSKTPFLAAGTELVGVDAELHLWDLRNTTSVVRAFVDSHHDDITAVKFHATKDYAMSGSTDGYVNVYNLAEPDEDEALHQVINYASVHLCHFTQPNRISVLSHMETLAFYELNNTDYESAEEPQPHDLGDVRALWGCEYTVDVRPEGYVAYGANLAQSLTMVPFNCAAETFDTARAVAFPGAHGEEVVRDVLQIGRTVVTCGEDGIVKAWTIPEGRATPESDEKREKREKKERKREKKEKKEKKRLAKEARYKPY